MAVLALPALLQLCGGSYGCTLSELQAANTRGDKREHRHRGMQAGAVRRLPPALCISITVLTVVQLSTLGTSSGASKPWTAHGTCEVRNPVKLLLMRPLVACW